METWIDWLHQSWHAESLDICPYSVLPVRTIIFGTTHDRLIKKMTRQRDPDHA